MSPASTNRNLYHLWPVACLLLIFLLLMSGLGDARLPLIFSFALVYLFFPIIQRLEAFGIKRQYAVLGIFALSSAASIAVLAIVVPGLISDLRTFIVAMPDLLDRSILKIEYWIAGFGFEIHLDRESIVQYVRNSLSEINLDILSLSTDWIRLAAGQIFRSFLYLMKFFLVPVFFFYMIMQWEEITRASQNLCPKKFRPKLESALNEIDRVLSGYIRGQLLVAAILACAYSTVLSIVGMPFAIVVGMLTGLLSIIPYVGFTLGLISSIAITLADFSWAQLIWVLIAMFVVQLLESFVITPKVVGDKVGLNNLEALLALIIGGNLFGFFGMLLAIPSGALLKKLIKELIQIYQRYDSSALE